MSDWGIDTNPDPQNQANDNNNLNGPAALRSAYAAMKAKADSMEATIATLQAESRQRSVTDTLTSLGIPASAAPLYGGDADPQKVTEWATTMKSVFGAGTPATTPANNQPPAPTLDPATQQQFQQMTEAGQQGTPLGNAEAAFASVGDAKNMQDLITAFNRMNGRMG